MSINSIPYKSDLSSLSSSLDSNCNNISIKLQSLPREMLWIHVLAGNNSKLKSGLVLSCYKSDH